MIPQIKEIEGKFPKYATLSQATVTLNDMGDKTISTQIKIDGDIAPNFSYDWEVEFQGERYIQPLREPQASKGNESICSVIDLTFYHKTIYDLKRYFFVEMASTGSGTAMVDKYIADLNVNLEGFCDALQEVLDYYYEIDYFEERITINLKGKGTGIYAEEKQYVQIQYTHIWDVVQKIYEIFGVRWSIEGREIKIGYPTEEVAHTFEYGFEGGLLKVERQVQSADIRNSLLGRGGSKNLPYRYFKETDPNNPSFQGDPDAIPELANIYFAELRGKTFRDYVKGWKAKHYSGAPMSEPTEAYTKGYTDKTFNPIEYVRDEESIKKYQLLENGLENVEEIFPTIQGVEIEGLGRADEVVEVEKVETDEMDFSSVSTHTWADTSVTKTFTITVEDDAQIFKLKSEPFSISSGMVGSVFDYLTSATIVANGTCIYYEYADKELIYEIPCTVSNRQFDCVVKNVKFYDADTLLELDQTTELTSNVQIYYEVEVEKEGAWWFDQRSWTETEWVNRMDPDTFEQYQELVTQNHESWYEMRPDFELTITARTPLYQIQFGGEIIDNSKDGKPLIGSISLAPNTNGKIVISASDLMIVDGPATMVDIPISINSYESENTNNNLKGSIEYKKSIILSNKETGERISAVNIPEGEYYCRVEVECHNNSGANATIKVSLLPTYLFPPAGKEKWLRTFNIWIKNIWNSSRLDGETDEAYAERVWRPILGDRQGEEARVCFSTGMLSSHSDYEFPILGFYYDNTQSIGDVKSEWRLTLEKSDAELESTGMYIPNSTTGGQAVKGDHFFFIGIDMPHQYVLWAEERLDQYKRDQLLETSKIKPTWVVQTDKVRLHESREGEQLVESLKIGNTLRLADKRFIKGDEKLYLQSITYTWSTDTTMLPDVEIVLSNKVTVSANPVSMLQGEVDALSKQVGSISNVQQIVRTVGDKLYLRRDGFDTKSDSTTTFNQQVNSGNYKQGSIGGQGWCLRSEQNKGVIECDKLVVRNEMRVNNFVINQISAIGGCEILSAASLVCSKVDIVNGKYKCYFDRKQGSVSNLFKVNDIAYSQVYNSNDIIIKYYKRIVVEVGDNYILLSSERDGNGSPQAGDVIIQYGNTSIPDRQYVIIRDVIGGGYERMLCGLDSVDATGEEYYFAGRLVNGTPRWFVGDANQYLEFSDGKIEVECKKVGMTSEGESSDSIRFWAGVDNTEKENAPFKVLQDGTILATKAEIVGTVNATSGTFNNGVFNNVTIKGSFSNPFASYIGAKIKGRSGAVYTRDMNQDDGGLYAWVSKNDNMVAFTEKTIPEVGTAITRGRLVIDDVIEYTNEIRGDKNGIGRYDNLVLPNENAKTYSPEELTWDISNSGRMIRIVNSYYNEVDEQPKAKIKLTAPDRMYFFEDGERYSNLIVSREVIEMIGYGDDDTFYGWIILNRKDVCPEYSYGVTPKVLYQGIISNGKLSKFWTPFFNRGGGSMTTPTFYSESGVLYIPLPEDNNMFRGVEDVENWVVLCTNAVVQSRDYYPPEAGKFYGTLEIQFKPVANYMPYFAFQIVSTADWQKI